MTSRDATLYACGRRATVREGVRHALRVILARHGGLAPDATEARLHAWEAGGRPCFGLTD